MATCTLPYTAKGEYSSSTRTGFRFGRCCYLGAGKATTCIQPAWLFDPVQTISILSAMMGTAAKARTYFTSRPLLRHWFFTHTGDSNGNVSRELSRQLIERIILRTAQTQGSGMALQE